MGRSALKTLAGIALAAAALGASTFACANSLGQGGPAPRIDGGPVCSRASDCAAGSQCTNGICAATCTDGGCSAGSYCEGSAAPRQICSADVPPGCLTSACPYPQSCYLGSCVSLQPLTDGGTSPCTGLDDCGPDAMCNPVSDGNGNTAFHCVAQAHCAQDGGCLSIPIGEVCNQKVDGGLFYPEKERLCLEYFCAANQDCQMPDICFHADQTSQLGGCSYGGPGAPCHSNADCPGSTDCSQRLADGGIAREVDGGVVDGGPADGGSGTCFFCNDGGSVCY